MVSDAKEKSQFLRLPFALTLSLSLSLSLPLPPYLSLSHSLTAPWAGWHSGSLSPPSVRKDRYAPAISASTFQSASNSALPARHGVSASLALSISYPSSCAGAYHGCVSRHTFTDVCVHALVFACAAVSRSYAFGVNGNSHYQVEQIM